MAQAVTCFHGQKNKLHFRGSREYSVFNTRKTFYFRSITISNLGSIGEALICIVCGYLHSGRKYFDFIFFKQLFDNTRMG